MPYYEFNCSDCEIYFDVTIEKIIDISEMWCLDCGGQNLALVNFDKDVSTRIMSLVSDINELYKRVERLENEDSFFEFEPTQKNKSTKN